MFTTIGQLTVRRRKLILWLSVAFVVLSVVLGSGVFSRLDSGGFEDPSSESTRAAEAVAHRFNSGQPNIVFLVDAVEGDVDSAAASAAGARLLDLVSSHPAVTDAVSYWSLGSMAQLRSGDGSTALVLARVKGDDDEQLEAARWLDERAVSIDEGVKVSPAGLMAVRQEVTSTIEGDLRKAESIAVPVTLVLLVVAFGGLVAAGLPLLTGAVAVVGSFLALFVIAQLTDVSIFSINLVTAMGLGLSIDYSLFIVSRFREELARHPRGENTERERILVDAAVIRSVQTAGRTVAFSALTVSVSLAALLVFPMYFLRSFAYAGIGVTLVAMGAAMFTLPALLASLGRRVDALSLRRRVPARRDSPVEAAGFWYRTAMFSQRHALVVTAAVMGVLVLLGLPFLRVDFGVPDERVLPADATARVATERLRSEFDSSEAEGLPVVIDGTVPDPQVDGYAAELSAIDGVTRVDAPTGRFTDGAKVSGTDPMLAAQRIDGALRLNVVPGVEAISDEGRELVAELRSVDGPGDEVLVGGFSASYVDTLHAIGQRLPWALGIIAVSTFVLLFLMFGSVLVPLKAVVLNVFSLSATFGAMVWVFQWGHGAGLLDFTPTGLTDLTIPILMFCIAFGLSMDYEVFLLSRISEEYHSTGDNSLAVASGLQRCGGIITTAAAVLAVTFVALVTSDITFIKLFGLGLALAVVVDATIIRALLVPALMNLAGDANWWAPRFMRRIHDRIGISESEHFEEDFEHLEAELALEEDPEVISV